MSLTRNLQRLFALFLLACCCYVSIDASVVGIDYGTDWFKVSLIKPGPSIETVLNRESKRKTASVVCIHEGVRYFGSDAVSFGVRHPQDTYATLKNVIGKSFEDPLSAEYRDTFTNTMVKDFARGVVAFQQDSPSMTWSLEALVGMELAHAKAQAETYGGEPVTGAVITVPPYFGVFERRVILDAAELAGIKVLSLMNDETAVAMSFAIAKKDADFEQPQYHIFYDMGAGSTVASLVKFSLGNSTARGPKSILDLQVQSMGYDSSLGGRSFDVRLQNLLVEKFLKGAGKDYPQVTTNIKAMAKFLKEANRVKQILSANQDTFTSIENVIDGVDFKSKVTREELESISKDLFDRVIGPVKSVLKDAKLELKDISSMVLVGGGVRIPAVQKALIDFVGNDKIARNVDGDEAAVFGAVYHAAAISAQFRTRREIKIKDITERAIQLKYPSEDASSGPMELTLFPAKSPLGAKKLVSFARTSDFTFDLLYADPKRPIAKVTVTGIEAAKDKHKDKRIKSVKVKALIGLTESGILEVSSAYALLDIYQDAKAKLTDTLGSVMSFFGGKKDNKDKGDGTDGDKEEEAPQEVDGSLNATNSTGNATAPVAVKSVMEKVDLKFTIDWQFQTPMTEAQKREIKSLMRKMDGEDQLRRVREEARNNLESYVYGTREFLYESDLEQVSTQEQRDALKSTLDVASEWMEDHAETASITDLRKHLDSLKTLREPMALRRTELGLRDPSVKAMEKALKKAQETVDSFEADLKKVEEEEKVLAGALAKVEAESAEKADKAEDAKDEEKKKESADDETKADKEEKPKKAKTPPPVSPNRPSPYVMNMYDSAKSTLKSTLEWFEATKAKQASKAATDEPVLLSKDLIAKQIFLGDRLGSFAKFVESEKAAREAQLKAQEKAKKDAKKAKAKKEEEAKANAAKEKTKDEKKDKSKEEKKEDVKDEL